MRAESFPSAAAISMSLISSQNTALRRVRQSRCLGCPEIHSMACAKPSVNASCRVGSCGVSGSLIHALNRSAMFVFMGGNDIGASPVACSGHSGHDLAEVLHGHAESHEHDRQVDDPMQTVRPASRGLVIVPLYRSSDGRRRS